MENICECLWDKFLVNETYRYDHVIEGSNESMNMSEFEMIKVSQRDWQTGYCFQTTPQKVSGPLTIAVALQKQRLIELFELYEHAGFENIIKESLVRRVSLVFKPNSFTPETFQFTHASNGIDKGQPSIIHWAIETLATVGQVYLQIGRLKEFLHNRLPVCITIPWVRYRAWVKNEKPDSFLKVLWEHGILVTVPIIVQHPNNCETIHAWCSPEVELNLEEYPLRKVHAIFQEVSGPQ
jgi:hypothetical protein